ncbi:MAG: hypothetical protein WB763_11380 [Terriglobia bacterium]
MAKARMRKLTILIPEDLLRRAQKTTQTGVTPTVRRGLQILAAQEAYQALRKMRGKVKFGLTWQEMRGDE